MFPNMSGKWVGVCVGGGGVVYVCVDVCISGMCVNADGSSAMCV